MFSKDCLMVTESKTMTGKPGWVLCVPGVWKYTGGKVSVVNRADLVPSDENRALGKEVVLDMYRRGRALLESGNKRMGFILLKTAHEDWKNHPHVQDPILDEELGKFMEGLTMEEAWGKL